LLTAFDHFFLDPLPHYIFPCAVVGQEELDAKSVNVRNRDDVGTKARAQIVPLDEVVQKLVHLKTSRSLENKL
jgi:threonyl-tRNA synthetase